jgi:hypothetical protein
MNGLLPTLATRSLPLRWHIVNELAVCMLMPASVNAIDSIIDADVGRELFAETAHVLLRERGATWREGVDMFREGMRQHCLGQLKSSCRHLSPTSCTLTPPISSGRHR